MIGKHWEMDFLELGPMEAASTTRPVESSRVLAIGSSGALASGRALQSPFLNSRYISL
jgi:hypothetical protein